MRPRCARERPRCTRDSRLRVCLNGQDFVDTGRTFRYYYVRVDSVNPAGSPLPGRSNIVVRGVGFLGFSPVVGNNNERLRLRLRDGQQLPVRELTDDQFIFNAPAGAVGRYASRSGRRLACRCAPRLALACKRTAELRGPPDPSASRDLPVIPPPSSQLASLPPLSLTAPSHPRLPRLTRSIPPPPLPQVHALDHA